MPLNGTKIHPLSPHAKGWLRDLARGRVVPVQEINAGVWSRLREDPAGPLVESYLHPSPYKIHKGAQIPHARITAEGRAIIESEV